MHLRPKTTLHNTKENKQQSNQTTMKTSYLALSEVLKEGSNDESDEATITSGNKYDSTRIQVMISVPAGDKSTTSLLLVTTSLIEALFNKLPNLKVAPWNVTEKTYDSKELQDTVPSDIEKAEKYIYNFSRFSTGPKGYFRMNIFHPHEISSQMIADVGREFNQPQAQSIYLAPSNAVSPSPVGVLMGSTETIMIGPDFAPTFQNLFDDPKVGFAWRFIQTGQKGKSDRNQKAIHLETESMKVSSLQAAMEKFFNTEQTTFLGTSMTFIKGGRYPSNAQKIKLQRYAPIQASLLSNMIEADFDIKIFQPIKISAPAPNGKPAIETKMTLMEALTRIQSITPKQCVKGESTSTFFGNLFYAISPNSESGMHTFQFLASNAEEATGVLKGLPYFLKEHYGAKNVSQYCRTSHRTNAKNGEWNQSTRHFISQQDKMEKIQFENLEMLAQTSVAPSYIDRNHQRAMTGMQPTDESTVRTYNETSVIRDDDSLSNMTGSTNTSKVKVAEARVAAEVAKQYVTKLQSSEDEIKKLKDLLLAAQNKNEKEMKEAQQPSGKDKKEESKEGTKKKKKKATKGNKETEDKETEKGNRKEIKGKEELEKKDTEDDVPKEIITNLEDTQTEILTIGESSDSSSSEASSKLSDLSSIKPTYLLRSNTKEEMFYASDESTEDTPIPQSSGLKKRKTPRSISSKSSTPTPRGPRGRTG